MFKKMKSGEFAFSCCSGDKKISCSSMMEKMKGFMKNETGDFDCNSMMKMMHQMCSEQSGKNDKK